MRLTVFSHKPCWRGPGSPTGYATDGGVPFQMRAISELFDAGARILQAQTATDPELASLTRGERIDAILARGSARVASTLGCEFGRKLMEQVRRIHRRGVAKLSLTFGNVIVDSRTGAPWLIDFERAIAFASRWQPAFLYRSFRDRQMCLRLYGVGNRPV